MALVILKLPSRERYPSILCGDHVNIVADGDMVTVDVNVPRLHEREVGSQRFKVRGSEMSAIPVFVVGVKFVKPIRPVITNHAQCCAIGYASSVANIPVRVVRRSSVCCR